MQDVSRCDYKMFDRTDVRILVGREMIPMVQDVCCCGCLTRSLSNEVQLLRRNPRPA